ncbi:hypothetical protein CEXT_476731 [Caerostris extrusa]|uniref:Uncharacterized protein n=1 Tax=Caerostris extrusa TaxID=172846 RepID=A0AAV4VJL4_CAEEX|nr:hypothetical protein CEXT_476731 [Caerostris extrusa]
MLEASYEGRVSFKSYRKRNCFEFEREQTRKLRYSQPDDVTCCQSEYCTVLLSVSSCINKDKELTNLSENPTTHFWPMLQFRILD